MSDEWMEQAIKAIDRKLDEIQSGKDLPYWINLKQACRLKGLAYKTALNRPDLQPRHGVPDTYYLRRKCWRRSVVLDWLEETDRPKEEQE